MKGKEELSILSAVLTVCCKVSQSETLQLPYQTVKHVVRMLSNVKRGADKWREAHLLQSTQEVEKTTRPGEVLWDLQPSGT